MSKTFRKYPIGLTTTGLNRRMREKDITDAYIEFNSTNARPYCWVAIVRGTKTRGKPKDTRADAQCDLEEFVTKLS